MTRNVHVRPTKDQKRSAAYTRGLRKMDRELRDIIREARAGGEQ